MDPKDIILQWVDCFNNQDFEGLAELYAEHCINHQTPNGFVSGKANMKQMFKSEFEQFEMVCIIENIFVDGKVGILEWKDPKGLRGCGFFWIEQGKIEYQRGYWDKLSFMQQQSKSS